MPQPPPGEPPADRDSSGGVPTVRGSRGPVTLDQLAVLHTPTTRIITVGIGLWVLALVLTLVVPSWHTGERAWWPWACVAGALLGLLGYAYVRRGRGNAADAE